MRRSRKDSDSNGRPSASPAAGLLFALGGLACFYGLITMVDPLL